MNINIIITIIIFLRQLLLFLSCNYIKLINYVKTNINSFPIYVKSLQFDKMSHFLFFLFFEGRCLTFKGWDKNCKFFFWGQKL